ncbi:MAG: winged helix DNA-binding domain-containing protein [Coriobacteriia bacterium]|nr:winged helix DNA-binding domain-containing protein [Coriobacteriia bacterium]
MNESVAVLRAVLGTTLADDTLSWVLESDEPYAAWTVRTAVLGEPADSPAAVAARTATLADPGVRMLVETLPSWDETAPEASGHHSPAYLPNRLNLLADMGVRGGDFDRIEALLDEMLAHQDGSGRFQAFGTAPGRPKPEWGSMLCDTNVIADVLMRFGRGSDERLALALDRMRSDLARTPQGPAWQCVPERPGMWRGPGRKADVCPQVTLEGLRAFSHLAEEDRPASIHEVARTPLEVWRRRAGERPYAFGHGYGFKSVKWPNVWYDVLWMLETLGRYPHLWNQPDAHPEDRRAVAELAACLVAYNVDPNGRVTPRRTYRSFTDFSFGRKTAPSPFATARLFATIERLTGLGEEIAAVDVTALPGSLGGSGTAVPPKRGLLTGREPSACPVPYVAARRAYPVKRVAAHMLTRQHLANRFEGASIESTVADLVGLHAQSQTTPYVSLAARLPGFEKHKLDEALYTRRSLVRYRCMRGSLFIVRREMLPVVAAATGTSVTRFARKHAQFRGVTPADYERLAPAILGILAEEHLTSQQVRERLGSAATVDIAATINLMCAEGLLLRDRPVGDWLDRSTTFVPLADALPDIRLDSVREDDAVRTLVRAYVRGFGPATEQDVSWWVGVGKPRVRRAFEQLEGELVEIELEGDDRTYLLHAADTDDLASASLSERPHVTLLPALDSLTMGYAIRGRLVADEHAPYVFDASRNMPAVVLVNGVIAGVWDVTSGPRPRVLVHLFEGPDDELREVVELAARLTGRFWHDAQDTDVDIEWVASMARLIDRPVGSFARPLRP